ncbi:hypothetical protein AAFF_G00272250 [Aldrovandia affinis]|uniref:Doublecortin domain-containing protein n=1 Tax=Aldrovandia affinis TaxID=143900 RepID=A0AAD7RAM9_9TELE|nr:hypothetical protein AAFF_G00272250 [Aldrovandia affinis]
MSEKAPPDPDPVQQDVSMGSRQTVASWPPIISNPLSPKRVCFYKSGDPQFSGLKVIITGRTFKTFDALLDSLSKKVPLPFGVRTITTPRGTHAVLSLEELEDGKAYLCSDQKKVKPINLEAARKRLVPWNTTPMASRGRRISPTPVGRVVKRDSSVVLHMPKTLTVFRNGDPSIRHTVLLQSSSSQTFETFLVHVSDVMQFRVVKLHTTDGGKNKGSMSGGLFDPHSNPLGSMDTVMPDCDRDSPAENGALGPHHNDIEKSFRINQDGSMTVEMKVRLTIKEEETIHWTTTLSRSCITSQLGAESILREPQQSRSLDSNRSLSEDPDDVGKGGPKVRLAVLPIGEEGVCKEGEDVGRVVAMKKPRIRRPPIPGMRVLREKEPSPQSIHTVSDIEVQENMEQTAEGTMVEKPRLARQLSGHPMANPRSAVSTAVANHSEGQSAFQSSKSEECFQIQNNGREITESSKVEEFMRDKSEVSRELDREKVTELQVVPDYRTVSRSVEIPEDLLEYVNSVLMSSSLVFSYNSKGNLRIEPDITFVGSVKRTFSANEHSQYGQKRLPSPNTSDLSDYRAETSESERCSSWPSVELSTESDREVSGGQPMTQGFVERYKGGNDTDFEESEAEGYSADCISSDPEGRTEEMGSLSYPKVKDPCGKPTKCTAPHTDEDMSNGVLIDNGRWLLKENHLIRKSPPVPSGMYGNAETTSAHGAGQHK